MLHLVNGAFSERWYEVSKANGKQAEAEAEWGRAIKPEQLEERLRAQLYDAVAIVLNETSTGVRIRSKMAAVIRQYPDTLILVDAVSILGGYKIDFDELGLDVLLTSTQRQWQHRQAWQLAASRIACWSAPSRCLIAATTSISSAGEIPAQNHTPATPNISLLYATDKQLDYMLAEGLEARFCAARADGASHARLGS